ncbi:MAG: hypothetical protein B7Y59_03915 [Burkholderiales bacterium 35-55-47]|jgi:hypothetical protein|uniref:hypothetical protein n=1 Tax=Limnohabitans sp. TaxID=1907725 RepID=UPI000BD88169|nr:hypothetical protein [Limnohabitans sp.]OYY20236.1 MAG: hypothetical protein B7Y59_03915 [Burkholderiales bacterium 35-55-47]OYZ74152.1 MAG: hypothetical protein B7Y06_01100 [Burkholderiales bacterium 24-55-52]OZB01956.1 MAG: hypothetical protein B7X62_03905 [Burkholderiales bacterium 39-55-53]HQR86486.1 hypothetical protein [Limnohabitans sp.]HQS25598.1 hypothetical protein [Limnohabitans sp.]
MTLFEIRQIIQKSELNRPNCRTATRQFLGTLASDYTVALTLTLNQKWFDKCGLMRVEHYLKEEDIPYIYARFQHQLNKLIWKNRYTRFGESVKMLRAWEDKHGTKRKHLHAALGNFPSNFKLNTLPLLVEKASQQCFEIDYQHKEDICDSGWIEYITKEVDKDNTDKILW